MLSSFFFYFQFECYTAVRTYQLAFFSLNFFRGYEELPNWYV